MTDDYTCINYLVAPAVLKTLCDDLPKNEVIEFIGSSLQNFTDYRYPALGDGYSPDAAMMKAILKNKGITRIDATKSDDDVSKFKTSVSRIACMAKEVESQLEGLQKKRKL